MSTRDLTVVGRASWTCCFCSKSYQRSDVLRRHYLRCSARGDNPIPGKLKKGKKSTVCDGCARLKAGCDLECPCETCLSYGIPCTYTRAQQGQQQQSTTSLRHPTAKFGSDTPASGSNIFSAPRKGSESSSSSNGDGEGSQAGASKVSLGFLLNYANPDNTTIPDAFRPALAPSGPFRDQETCVASSSSAETFEDPSSSAASSASASTGGDQPMSRDMGHIDDLFVSYLFPNNDLGKMRMSGELVGIDYSGTELEIEPWTRLIDALAEFTSSLPEDHPESAPNPSLAKSATLFSAANMDRLRIQYFRDWSPHSPIIHPPSFCMAGASPALLLAVCLIGAFFSPVAEEVRLAKDVVNLAEEYVFGNAVFRKMLSGHVGDSESDRTEALQAIQAALCLTQIQLRTGSPAKRKESRDSRFHQIILACRATGLLTCSNPLFHAEAPPQELYYWQGYAVDESRLRLICGIFNLDASFAILYNMAPRLFVEEMEVDLPGPIDAFLATNPIDCYDAAMKKHHILKPNQPPWTLARLCDVILGDEWDEETSNNLMRSLSILDLFILVLGLLQVLWLAPYKPKKDLTVARLRQALDRWKTIWDFQMSTLTPEEVEKYGFPKVAALEFWLLATMLVKKGKTRLDMAVVGGQAGQQNSGSVDVHLVLERLSREEI